jgi:hypothetical protein
MNSTRAAFNADNMSRKSGFNVEWLQKRIGVDGQLPHHLQPVSHCGFAQIVLGPLLGEWSNSE